MRRRRHSLINGPWLGLTGARLPAADRVAWRAPCSRSCWEPTTPDPQVRRPFAKAKRTAGESSLRRGSVSALAASTPRYDAHRRRSRLPGGGYTRVTVSRQGIAPAGRLQLKTFACWSPVSVPARRLQLHARRQQCWVWEEAERRSVEPSSSRTQRSTCAAIPWHCRLPSPSRGLTGGPHGWGPTTGVR